MTANKKLVNNIKAIMRKKDITQVQLAAMIGMSEGHLSRVLQGRISPGVDKVEKIAAALGMPVAALWDEEQVSTILAMNAIAGLPREVVEALGSVREREWLLLGLSMKDKNLTKEEIEVILAAYAQLMTLARNGKIFRGGGIPLKIIEGTLPDGVEYLIAEDVIVLNAASIKAPLDGQSKLELLVERTVDLGIVLLGAREEPEPDEFADALVSL